MRIQGTLAALMLVLVAIGAPAAADPPTPTPPLPSPSAPTRTVPPPTAPSPSPSPTAPPEVSPTTAPEQPSAAALLPTIRITTTTSTLLPLQGAYFYALAEGVPPGTEVRVERKYGDVWKGITTGTLSSTLRHRQRVSTATPGYAAYRVSIVDPTTQQRVYSNEYRYKVILSLRAKAYAASSYHVRYSWHSGCPVGPSGLTVVEFIHLNFNRQFQWGKIIVRDGYSWRVRDVFGHALEAGFPLRRVKTADAYGGSDMQMMAADNTSAFNCRQVTGNPYLLSPHSYGTAFDVNTVENPYKSPIGWLPEAGKAYLDRSNHRPGMLFYQSVVTTRFRALGMRWGGQWAAPDYQHFNP